jgi:hypothetical protein
MRIRKEVQALLWQSDASLMLRIVKETCSLLREVDTDVGLRRGRAARQRRSASSFESWLSRRRECHIFAPPSATRLRPQGFDATAVISHMRAVDRAQRNPHCRRNGNPAHGAKTIWLRWRCLSGMFFQCSACLSRRTSPFPHAHLFPRIRWP